jgi:hypothetical protein
MRPFPRRIKMRKIRQTPRKPPKTSVSVELAKVLHQQALELWQPPTPSPMEQIIRGLKDDSNE